MTTSNKTEPLYPDISSKKKDKINTRISIKVSPINNEVETKLTNSSRSYLEFKINTRTNDLKIESHGIEYEGSEFNVDELMDALNLIKMVHNSKE